MIYHYQFSIVLLLCFVTILVSRVEGSDWKTDCETNDIRFGKKRIYDHRFRKCYVLFNEQKYDVAIQHCKSNTPSMTSYQEGEIIDHKTAFNNAIVEELIGCKKRNISLIGLKYWVKPTNGICGLICSETPAKELTTPIILVPDEVCDNEKPRRFVCEYKPKANLTTSEPTTEAPNFTTIHPCGQNEVYDPNRLCDFDCHFKCIYSHDKCFCEYGYRRSKLGGSCVWHRDCRKGWYLIQEGLDAVHKQRGHLDLVDRVLHELKQFVN